MSTTEPAVVFFCFRTSLSFQEIRKRNAESIRELEHHQDAHVFKPVLATLVVLNHPERDAGSLGQIRLAHPPEFSHRLKFRHKITSEKRIPQKRYKRQAQRNKTEKKCNFSLTIYRPCGIIKIQKGKENRQNQKGKTP